jgi:hypothetical protein
MAYATGKFSYGLCDYCGQRYPYNTLRKNWKGFKVCPDDYEPKEPQLEPLRYRGDAIALQEPRPDRIEPVSVAASKTLLTCGRMYRIKLSLRKALLGK